jgi:hypothetical protein
MIKKRTELEINSVHSVLAIEWEDGTFGVAHVQNGEICYDILEDLENFQNKSDMLKFIKEFSSRPEITKLRKIYQVVGEETKYYTLQELMKVYKVIGYEFNPRVREELRGTPKLAGLCGAMWGGMDGTTCVIRYETPPVNRALSI